MRLGHLHFTEMIGQNKHSLFRFSSTVIGKMLGIGIQPRLSIFTQKLGLSLFHTDPKRLRL